MSYYQIFIAGLKNEAVSNATSFHSFNKKPSTTEYLKRILNNLRYKRLIRPQHLIHAFHK